MLLQLTNEVIRDDLTGKQTIGLDGLGLIVGDMLSVVECGCFPLLLTGRRQQVDQFEARFKESIKKVVILRGGMGSMERQELLAGTVSFIYSALLRITLFGSLRATSHHLLNSANSYVVRGLAIFATGTAYLWTATSSPGTSGGFSAVGFTRP